MPVKLMSQYYIVLLYIIKLALIQYFLIVFENKSNCCLQKIHIESKLVAFETIEVLSFYTLISSFPLGTLLTACFAIIWSPL